MPGLRQQEQRGAHLTAVLGIQHRVGLPESLYTRLHSQIHQDRFWFQGAQLRRQQEQRGAHAIQGS